MRTRSTDIEEEDGCPKSSKKSKFTLCPSFFLFKPQCMKWSKSILLKIIFTKPIQMLSSSRNTLTDTWRNVLPAIGVSLSPITSINHHKDLYRGNQSKVQWAVTHCDCHPCKKGKFDTEIGRKVMRRDPERRWPSSEPRGGAGSDPRGTQPSDTLVLGI